MRPLALVLSLLALFSLALSCVGTDCNGKAITYWKAAGQAASNARNDPSGVGTACYEVPGSAPQSFDVARDAGMCSAEPSDGACALCLAVGCCTIIRETCAAADPATCVALPAVKGCIMDNCGQPCGVT